MNIRPLILRELRAESRRPNSYWVRALAAAAITALFAWAALTYRGNPNSLGLHLFETLSIGFVLAIVVIIAGLTGDSISREKREGTLGLLLLTPLTPRDIVVGKALLHLLRAIPILLAILPIIGLPFVLGGIPPSYLLVLGLSAFQSLLLAVAAGIFASVRSSGWIQSIVLAELFAGFLAAGKFVIELPLFSAGPGLRMTLGLVLGTLFSILAVVISIFFAGAQIKRSWQSESISGRQPFWIRVFSDSSFWRTAFHWNTAAARDKNPIAWLQEYNWTSRLTKWGWAILLFFAQVKMLFQVRRYVDYQLQLYALVAFGIAFSAAASFRAERQSGALELLLVTPVSAAKLLWGRLQGIWFHFLPPIAILATVWIMGPQWISLPHHYLFYLAGAYFCIPPIGFYISLLTSNVLVSWLVTLFFSMLIPYAVLNAFNFSRAEKPIVFFSVQAFLALGAFYLLHENLAKRRFALSA